MIHKLTYCFANTFSLKIIFSNSFAFYQYVQKSQANYDVFVGSTKSSWQVRILQKVWKIRQE